MIDGERMKKRAKLIRPLLVPMVLYLGLMFFAVYWAPANETSPWRYVVVILPIIPGIFLALGVVRASSRLDEMERRILLESATFSFTLTLILLISQGLLGLVDVPQLGSASIAAVMCFLLLIGKFWGNWRYR